MNSFFFHPLKSEAVPNIGPRIAVMIVAIDVAYPQKAK